MSKPSSRKYDGKVNFQDLDRFTCLGPLADEAHVTIYTAVVWHKRFGRKLRLVVLVNRKDPQKPRCAGDDRQLEADTVVRYGRAFRLSFFSATRNSSPA